MFLPGRDLEWEWWTIREIRQYIRDGGLDDEELLGMVGDVECGEVFLALVIQYAGGAYRQEAHFHRINKASLN